MKLFIILLIIKNCFCLLPSRRGILSNLVYSPSLLINQKNDNEKFVLNQHLMNEDKSHDIIQQVNNNIYFYSSVSQESCFELTKMLIDIDKTSQEFILEYGVYSPPINLHIQSQGGSVLHALYVIDTIKSLKTPVHTYINGFAASAATLISIVGDKRFISQNSLMLIHQISSFNSGKYDKMEEEMENLDNLMKIVIDVYLNNSKLNRNDLIDILKKDIWLDSKTCLSYGLIDVIY